jgi:hypothetical protein
MFPGLLTSGDIASVLRVASKDGRPHSRLITAVIKDIGTISPVKNYAKYEYYDSSVVQLIRRWFYHRVGIDFDEFIKVGKRKYMVRYLPEENGLSLPAVKKIIA